MKNNTIPINVHPFFAYSTAMALRLGTTTEAMCSKQMDFHSIREHSPLTEIVDYLISQVPIEVQLFDKVTFSEFGMLQKQYPKSTWSIQVEESGDTWRSSTYYQLVLRLDDEETDTHKGWKVWDGWDRYDMRKEGALDKIKGIINNLRAFVEQNSGVDNLMKDMGYIVDKDRENAG